MIAFCEGPAVDWPGYKKVLQELPVAAQQHDVWSCGVFVMMAEQSFASGLSYEATCSNSLIEFTKECALNVLESLPYVLSRICAISMSDFIYNSMVERKAKNKVVLPVIEATAEPPSASDPRVEDDSPQEQAEDQHQPPELASRYATVLAEVIMVDSTKEKM